MKATGWAVIQDRQILVRTIQSERRGAIVNYLVTDMGFAVRALVADHHIESLWNSRPANVQVAMVTITGVEER